MADGGWRHRGWLHSYRARNARLDGNEILRVHGQDDGHSSKPPATGLEGAGDPIADFIVDGERVVRGWLGASG